MKIDVFICAAGLGTRLMPLTEHKPKALVAIDQLPLLWHSLQKLSKLDIGTVFINAHHFSQQVVAYLNSVRDCFDFEIKISDETNLLLNTGGGLKKIAKQIKHPLLMFNVDILFDLPLSSFIDEYISVSPDCLLAVKKRNTSRYLVFNKERLVGWQNIKTGETKGTVEASSDNFAFSGIQILSPSLVSSILDVEADVFSIIDFYLAQCDQRTILAYTGDYRWMDVGRYEHFGEAEEFYRMLNQQ